ncbi:NERD domain-containing protein [Virgibacillus sp. FSP13]
MAQLIKLEDYVSRYGWNVFRYPSQYIRLKQENWNKLNGLWDDQNETLEQDKQDTNSTKHTSTISKWKAFFKREVIEEEPVHEEALPKTEHELKQYFLDKLYPIQLKWASSTVTELSFMEKSYYHDATLKYFLQRFPDTYLLMYYPTFRLKNAPIDGEVIFISPIGIEIIYLLEDKADLIMVTDERTWIMETNHTQSKILSPIVALKRTEQIIKSILSKNDIDFPVKKVVLSRTNHIIGESESYHTNIIGKQGYEKWFEEKRKLKSPLKNRQLKVADALLKHCQTTSVKRPEWEEETTTTFSVDDEG